MKAFLAFVLLFAARGQEVKDLQSADELVAWMESTGGPLVRPCWTELQKGDCCRGNGSVPDSCFDRVYTREECCTGDEAVMIPLALPDSACVQPAGTGRRLAHPAFSDAQRRFERRHRRAVRLWEVELLGVKLRAVDFKTSQKVQIISDELKSDPYRLKHLAEHLQLFGISNATLVDIGANVGLVSLLLARMNPSAEVLALEPVPEFYRFLLWNLKLNGLTERVWALNAGMGKEGCRSLSYPLDAVFWWLPPELPWARGSCLSFADLLAFMEVISRFGFHSKSPVHFLKIDCEGCEFDVFHSKHSFELASWRVQRFAGEVHEICLDCAAEAREEHAWRRVLGLLCGQGGHPNLAMTECQGVAEQGGVEAHVKAVRLDRRGSPQGCPDLAGG